MSAAGIPAPPLILTIDDDATISLLVRVTLEQAGFRVEQAESGPAGLERFDQLHPAAVLMDVMMPGMDGFAVSTELRRRPGGGQIPILMMTGLDDHESIDRAFDAGATDFITKPINFPLLGYRVRYLLRASTAMNRLRESERRLATAQRIARLGHWDWLPGENVLHLSEQVCQIMGLDCPDGKLPYQALLDRVPEKDQARVRGWFAAVREGRQVDGINHWLAGFETNPRCVRQQVEAVFDESGQLVRVYGTLQDITELQRAEERIRHLAFFDGLTQLPNRELFKDRLSEALKLAKRYSRRVGLLFLDLDNFKRINDTLGHAVGDLLLQATADRLKESLRESDTVARPAGDERGQTIARLGGDEFTVLLPEIRYSADVALVAEHIRTHLSRPLLLAGHEVFVTPSIGIAVFPEDGDDPGVLLRNADMAMYLAKRQGRNLYRFYDATLNEAALRRLTMESQLRKAIEQNDLALHYQPQLDLPSGRINGLEALLRWDNAILGSISPVDFIPLAEETGLIVPIGEWVMRSACQQAKQWRDQGIDLQRIAVNISVLQFTQPDFPGLVARVLEETGLEPSALELEITESLLMKDPEYAIATLQALKGLGVQLAIDDFGTGYSSFSRLKQLPLDRLKLDKAFVREVNIRPDDAAIATAVIAMADGMGLRVIAEGVENEGQLRFLKAQHCDEIQGYYLSRPLPVTEITDLLRRCEQGLVDKAILVGEERVLLIVAADDDKRASVQAPLVAEGYRVLVATDVPAALDLLARHPIGVMLADWRMQQDDQGLFWRVRELYPETLRIAMGEGCEAGSLVELINQGAICKFLSSPAQIPQLREIVREAFLNRKQISTS